MNKYKISFLKEYLKLKKIPFTLLSNELKVSSDRFSNQLNGICVASEEELNSLLQIFNVSSYNELIKLVKEDKNTSIENINLDIYDISFLKEYLKLKKVYPIEIADLLNMNANSFVKNLNGNTRNINSEQIKKILEIFNVSSLEELKELTKNDKSESIDNFNIERKYYDFSFFKPYLEKNNISLYKVYENLDIIQSNFYPKISGKAPITQEELDKILNLYNVETYEELKNSIDDNVLPEELQKLISKTKNNNYDFKFLYDFLKKNDIIIAKLASDMNLSSNLLYSAFYKSYAVESTLKTILDYFECNSYEELKEKIENNLNSEEFIDKIKSIETKESVKILSNHYDISFLKPYLKLKGISQRELAVAIGKTQQFVEIRLNGESISNKDLKTILELFKVETYEELEELTKNDKTTSVENFDDRIKFYDISFLKEYFLLFDRDYKIRNLLIEKLNINQRILKKLMMKSKINVVDLKKVLELFEVNTYDELQEKIQNKLKDNINDLTILDDENIDINLLIELISDYDITKDKYEVITMIFNKEKKYNIMKIKKVTNLSKKEILEVYNFCLKIYKEKLKSKNVYKNSLQNKQ